ncbi:MAG TPA: hypothetical protein VLI04_03260 [Nocardioidaceae bacterium]|nr:hypothetical protein [Nocardioidaceae bacterium]
MSLVTLRASNGRLSRLRIALALAILAALAAALIAFDRLSQLHDETGEWTYSPAAASPKIVFGDRDYDRGRRQALPAGWVEVDRTPGGGIVYSSPDRPGTPVLLFVRDGDDVTWAYGLIGGP